MEGVNPPYFLERRLKTLRGKKIIVFFLLITALLMPVAVFADTYGMGSFINEYRHYMVARFSKDGGYQVFCTNAEDPSELIRMEDEDGNRILVTGNGVVRYYTFDYGITWSAGTQIGNTLWPTVLGDSQPILESTFNVKRPSGTVFFYRTVPPTTILVATMEGVESGMILQTILAGLIPLVGCLILGISFRKGWVFLRRQLMH